MSAAEDMGAVEARLLDRLGQRGDDGTGETVIGADDPPTTQDLTGVQRAIIAAVAAEIELVRVGHERLHKQVVKTASTFVDALIEFEPLTRRCDACRCPVCGGGQKPSPAKVDGSSASSAEEPSPPAQSWVDSHRTLDASDRGVRSGVFLCPGDNDAG